mmetsp:Transcript_77164/g.154703  ORF Transcript_77164/g.154703 Transcript_77164/m.154703 type:complete len:138 (+) Transcript_77164:35-448(+)
MASQDLDGCMQQHFPVHKMALSQCASLLDGEVTPENLRRCWLQGHVCSVNDSQIFMDDGTAVVAVTLGPAPVVPTVGEYIMVIGSLPNQDDGPIKRISSHQLISLEDPNREILWWAEVMEAKLLLSDETSSNESMCA